MHTFVTTAVKLGGAAAQHMMYSLIASVRHAHRQAHVNKTCSLNNNQLDLKFELVGLKAFTNGACRFCTHCSSYMVGD